MTNTLTTPEEILGYVQTQPPGKGKLYPFPTRDAARRFRQRLDAKRAHTTAHLRRAADRAVAEAGAEPDPARRRTLLDEALALPDFHPWPDVEVSILTPAETTAGTFAVKIIRREALEGMDI